MADPSSPPRSGPDIVSVLVLLGVLALVGVVLFGIAKLLPEPESRDATAAAVTRSPTTPSLTPQPSGSSLPRPAGRAARRVAIAWAEAFTTYTWRDHPDAAWRELARWSTKELVRDLRDNSSAAALRARHKRQRLRASGVAAGVQTIEGRGEATDLLVIVRQTIRTRQDKKLELRSVGVGLERSDGRWLVAKVLQL